MVLCSFALSSEGLGLAPGNPLSLIQASESPEEARSLTLTDFRIDLAQFLKGHPGVLEAAPVGTYAITSTIDADIPPGVVFCLRAEGAVAAKGGASDYPLTPIYLVHVGDDGAVLLPYPQAKRIMDRLERVALGRELPDDGALRSLRPENPARRGYAPCAEAAGGGHRLRRRHG